MPTPLISFQDAVTASNLDPSQKFAVYYADGRYANRTAVAQRCPHAKLFGITVGGLTGKTIFACDSETGDLTVPSTIRWVESQIALRVPLICVYANSNRWLNEGLLADVQALERKHGVHVKKWVADFDNVPVIPAWADAKQFADPGPIDRNVALADFFGPLLPKPEPAVHWYSAEVQISVPANSSGTARFHGTVDLKNGTWTVGGLPGVVHWSGPGGGKWRVKGMPLDSEPLGK
jgi:hypothetical protein